MFPHANLLRSATRRRAASAMFIMTSVLLAGLVPVSPADASQQHEIKAGETLSAIAARYAVSVGAITEANGITQPDLIRMGDLLVVPVAEAEIAEARHQVVAGETLSGIARAYGVSVTDLVARNGLADGNVIRVGDTLSIGAPGATAAATAAVAAPPNDSVQHVVAAGESLARIAARYGTSIDVIVDRNAIVDPNHIVIGTTLSVPAAHPAPSGGGTVESMLGHWASYYGVPADLLKALTWFESGWNNAMVSSVGAVGIGQLMPATVDFVSGHLIGEPLDPNLPDHNVRMSARFLRYLLDQTNWDLRLTLASYYQGLRATRTHGVYASSEFYVAGILALRARF